jgi:3-oxoacyl-[acyl-carrier protein] reductase
MSLDNKVALITGASRGIGQAVMLSLAAQGAYVVGTATSEAGSASIDATLKQHGLQGEGQVLNVCDADSVSALFTALKAEKMPDILINNAAVTQDNILLRMKQAQWDDVISTNLTGPFSIIKQAIRAMVKARWGRIVNISSVVAATGNLGQANYTAAKAGIIGMSKSMAIEVARYGVTINNVSPGFVDTDMTRALPEVQREALIKSIPMRRMGDVQDIANAVVFLASDKASYITGETLHVNGAMYMA